MTTPQRKKRLPVTPAPLSNPLLDRLAYAYRFNAEHRPSWTVVSVDMVDLRIVLEANGVDISKL